MNSSIWYNQPGCVGGRLIALLHPLTQCVDYSLLLVVYDREDASPSVQDVLSVTVNLS